VIAKLFICGLLFWSIREVRHKVLYLSDNGFRVEAIAFRSDVTIPRIDPTLPTVPIIIESTTLFFYAIDYGRNLGQVAWATTFCSVGPVNGTCLMSSFWLLESVDGYRIFGKFVEPWT